MLDVDYYRKFGFARCTDSLFSANEFSELEKICRKIYSEHPDESSYLQSGNLHIKHPELLNYLLHDSVLDKAESVIGPNLGLWTTVLFYKAAGARFFFEWHTDFNQDDFYEDFLKLESTNMLIAVTPSTLESGCVRYMPGTHLQRGHRRTGIPTYDQVKDLAPDFYRAPTTDSPNWPQYVSLELQPNQCSFHDAHVLHSSDRNKSSHDRILLSFWFFDTSLSGFSAAAKKYVASQSGARIHLRGRDEHGACRISLVGS